MNHRLVPIGSRSRALRDEPMRDGSSVRAALPSSSHVPTDPAIEDA